MPERAALDNLAFAPAEPEIRSSYDTAALEPAVIADGGRNGPPPAWAGCGVTEQEQAAPLRTPPLPPLPPPGDDAVFHTYRTDLSKVRALVLQQGLAAGLAESRATDLVLAVSEVAANTLRHTQSAGMLTIWRQPGELVCEIQDEGTIADPLAGQAQARARRHRRARPVARLPGLRPGRGALRRDRDHDQDAHGDPAPRCGRRCGRRPAADGARLSPNQCGRVTLTVALVW